MRMRSSSENGADELLVVEGLFFFQIEFFEEFCELILGKFLPGIDHGVFELFDENGRASRFENGHHGLNELVFGLGLFVLACHEG